MHRANDAIRERFAGSSGSVVRRRSLRMASLTRCSCGSGSFAFPAPRSSLPVARSNLRGFPLNHRPLLASLRSLAGARPSWASLLSRTGAISGFPFHRPRSVICRPSLMGFVGACPVSLSSTSSPVFAFPRCCHRFGPEQQARIAFRPRRFARPRRVSPPISRVFTRIFVTVQDDEGLAGLLHPAADRRVRCVSVAPPGGVGPRSVTIAGGVPCRSLGLRLPASKFVPLGGFPSPAAVARLRARCPLGLFAVSGPRPSRQLRFQRCRSCRTGGTRSLEALLRE